MRQGRQGHQEQSEQHEEWWERKWSTWSKRAQPHIRWKQQPIIFVSLSLSLSLSLHSRTKTNSHYAGKRGKSKLAAEVVGVLHESDRTRPGTQAGKEIDVIFVPNQRRTNKKPHRASGAEQQPRNKTKTERSPCRSSSICCMKTPNLNQSSTIKKLVLCACCGTILLRNMHRVLSIVYSASYTVC